MSETRKIEGEAKAALADENALLRAALSDMRARLGELEELADHDVLTPLPNRRRFMRDLDRVVGQVTRHGTPAAMLHIDVTGLAAINAAHGQLAGDAALIHVARLLAGLIRSTDIAARIGGDAFGLILDHLDHNSAIETAERIGRCIALQPLDIGGKRLAVAVRVGCAGVLAGDDCEGVMRRAERAASLTED